MLAIYESEDGLRDFEERKTERKSFCCWYSKKRQVQYFISIIILDIYKSNFKSGFWKISAQCNTKYNTTHSTAYTKVGMDFVVTSYKTTINSELSLCILQCIEQQGEVQFVV